jgi:hypothetical protein
MAVGHIHLEGGGETFLAVTAGAFLAAVAGFATNQVERRLHRRERERDAALLFGEIIAGLRLIIEVMQSSQAVGDPYGPVTLRMTKAAQREVQAYERNRESLFHLHDAVARARIHTLFVRLALALDGVVEANTVIETLQMAAPAPPDLEALLERRRSERASAFGFSVELVKEMEPILDSLKRTARYAFEHHQTTIRQELGMPRTPGPDVREA